MLAMLRIQYVANQSSIPINKKITPDKERRWSDDK
jgi:hypothetical protein